MVDLSAMAHPRPEPDRLRAKRRREPAAAVLVANHPCGAHHLEAPADLVIELDDVAEAAKAALADVEDRAVLRRAELRQGQQNELVDLGRTRGCIRPQHR